MKTYNFIYDNNFPMCTETITVSLPDFLDPEENLPIEVHDWAEQYESQCLGSDIYNAETEEEEIEVAELLESYYEDCSVTIEEVLNNEDN